MIFLEVWSKYFFVIFVIYMEDTSSQIIKRKTLYLSLEPVSSSCLYWIKIDPRVDETLILLANSVVLQIAYFFDTSSSIVMLFSRLTKKNSGQQYFNRIIQARWNENKTMFTSRIYFNSSRLAVTSSTLLGWRGCANWFEA